MYLFTLPGMRFHFCLRFFFDKCVKETFLSSHLLVIFGGTTLRSITISYIITNFREATTQE